MSRMKVKLRFPAIALAAVLLFAGLYLYVSMNIETSLLERDIRLARYEKRDWERKNSAIRAEIARLEGEGFETIYWKLYGALPFYEENTIIYVDLAELQPGLFAAFPAGDEPTASEKESDGPQSQSNEQGQQQQPTESNGSDSGQPVESNPEPGKESGPSWLQFWQEPQQNQSDGTRP
ncbi:MAG: hypothetical protein KDK23_03570 [Leptospiraceae bacterium]|nr:hypothetical protein [Leptospiraceae bacterium]